MDLDRAAIMERAWRALDDTAGIEEDLAERSRANRERRLLGETGARASQQPEAPRARQCEGRHWAEEVQDIATAVVDQKIAGLAEPIGMALAEMRRQVRAEMKETTDRLRGEIRAEFVKALDKARDEVLRGIAKDGKGLVARLDQHLVKFDALIARWERTDAVRGLGLAGDLLPN
jgi:hypothetical protein